MRRLSEILFLFGIIVFTAFSCEEENENSLIAEIPIYGNTKIVTVEENGIEFKFCLLNENGDASTILDEEEYFIFHFSIKNKNNFDIAITLDFINENFFKVYQIQNNKTVYIGRSWNSVFCEFNMWPEKIILNSEETLTLEVPWIKNPEVIRGYSPFCFDSQVDNLLNGKYYTSLGFDLHYSVVEIDYKIRNVSLKVNFEVK